MKTPSIRRLLGLALLSVSSHLMAAAPTLSWTSTVDTGTSVNDATRLIRKVNNGDLIVASQTGTGAAAGFRIERLNTTTGTAIWTSNSSPGDSGEDVDDIVIDPATGDAYIAGRATFTGNLIDWYVFKVRGSDGVIQWSYTYNGPFGAGNDVVRSICMTSDGNVVVAGQISNAVLGAIGGRVIKLNSTSGALMWEYKPSVDWQDFFQVVADSAGNAIVTGYIDGASLNTENGYTVKLNATGGEVWTSTFNGTANDFDSGLALAVDTSDNVYIAVESRLTGTNDDIVVAKLAAGTGFEQWRSSVSGAIDGTDVPTVIQLDGSNNVYVGGQVRESGTANHAALAKLNPSTGAVAWKSVVDGTDPAGFENFRCIAFNGSEVYAATTIQNTISATAQNDIFVGRFDPANGSLLWSINYNSTGTKGDNLSNKKGASLIAPATDTIYVCGTSQNPAATQTDGVLLKFAPAGPVTTAPTVSTAAQSAVTHNSATLGGDVTADGGASVTERGIVWGTSANPTTANTKVANGSGTGVFSGTVTGLPSNTLVHVRAYAINSVNTSYGNDISFTTLVAPVAVTSLNTANATPTNAATVNWTLTFPSVVTGVTASNFSLTGPAAAGLIVGTPTTGNGGLTWNIPVATGATDGLLTLNLANATGLSATISTALPFTGQSYTIDKTPPTVLSVTRLTPLGQTTNLTTLTFRVTYSEPVALNAPAASRFQVVPVNGSNIVGTVQSVTGAGNIRDVTVNLASGTGEFRLRVID